MKVTSDAGPQSFQDGKGRTTKIGYVNGNNQKCLGHRDHPGHHNQTAYKMKCRCCCHVYGANGADIWERKCPECQCGKPGIPY